MCLSCFGRGPALITILQFLQPRSPVADAQSRLRLLENTAKFVFIKIRGHLCVYTPGGGAGQRGDPGARGQASAAPPKSKPALRPLTRAPWPRSAMVRATIRILHLAWIAPRATFGTPGSVPLRSSRICNRAAMPRYNVRRRNQPVAPPEAPLVAPPEAPTGTTRRKHRRKHRREHAPEAPPGAPPGARAGITIRHRKWTRRRASNRPPCSRILLLGVILGVILGVMLGCDTGCYTGCDTRCDTGG